MKQPVHFRDLDVGALLAFTADMGTLAERVGVNRRTLHRLAHTGLTIDQADDFALSLGVHPLEVWPCWPSPSQPVRRFTCRWCSRTIVQPVMQGARPRRTCSQRCRDALSRNRHLETRRANDRERFRARSIDPQYRAARAARARRARADAAA